MVAIVLVAAVCIGMLVQLVRPNALNDKLLNQSLISIQEMELHSYEKRVVLSRRSVSFVERSLNNVDGVSAGGIVAYYDTPRSQFRITFSDGTAATGELAFNQKGKGMLLSFFASVFDTDPIRYYVSLDERMPSELLNELTEVGIDISEQ